jgi:uncharacterized protein
MTHRPDHALLAALPLALSLAFAPHTASASTQGVVISQVYGGNGATFANDYVELTNGSSTAVSVAGWSVQYASATGTGTFGGNGVVALPSTTLQPGQHLLVALASSGTGASLPAPDASGSINLSSSAGKVVLLDNATGLACNGGSSPCSADQLAQIIDLVGYGSANFFEGAAAPALTSATAALRAQDGCADTDNNAADFTAGTPAPRNTASAASNCGGSGGTPLAIYEIQGSGSASSRVGDKVQSSGVVTRVNNNGFFIQDQDGDNDKATSDGIFVFTGSAPTVSAGQLVQLTGTVAEFNVGTTTNPDTLAHPLTELTGITDIVVLGSGFTIAPTAITFPEMTNDDLERVEGMLVRINKPLTVSQNFFLGRFGQLTVSSGGRLEQPTNRFRPGTQAQSLADKNARRRLLLDDGTSIQNPNPTPYIGMNNTVRSGDRIDDGLTGVIDYGLATSSTTGAGDYRLQPTVSPVISRRNDRTTTPPWVGGNLRLASFNTLNYFTTFTDGTTADGQSGQGCSLGGVVLASNCRGASNLAEFNRQRAKTIESLAGLDADAVALVEMQNNGATAVANLVAGLNAKLGAGTYAAVPDPTSGGGTGTDAIKVTMIYKPARLTRVGNATSDASTVHNRPPMAQTFRHGNGAEFTFIANHFKSKSCTDAAGADLDQGDLQGCYNATRIAQAQALRAFVTQRQNATGNPDVVLAGDFNAYAKEDPVIELTGNGFIDEIGRFEGNSFSYSFIFDGASGRLDHLFTTPSISGKVKKALEWHINADEPSMLDYNLEFKQPACSTCAPDLYTPTAFRSADHDPALMGLTLPAATTPAMPQARSAQR